MILLQDQTEAWSLCECTRNDSSLTTKFNYITINEHCRKGHKLTNANLVRKWWNWRYIVMHTAESAVSLLHCVVHRNDRDILWGAFWPEVVLMALVRYKKFVHKNRACSNIKNKTTLPTKSCNILQIRLDKYRGIYTRVNNCGNRIQEIICMLICERVTPVNYWPMNCFIELIQKSDQSWSRWIWSVCLISIWKRIKTIRKLIKMILKGSKQSELEIYMCIWSWPSKSVRKSKLVYWK